MKARTAVIAATAGFLAGSAAALHEGSALPPAAPLAFGVIVLDPGHGGDDLGAVRKGRREKDIALEIARRLRSKLERLGASAVLTRDSDVYVPLDRRIAMVDDSAAAFVSLHVDKVPQTKPSGIRVFSYGRQSVKLPVGRSLGVPPLPDPPRDVARAGQRLATALAQSLRAQGLEVDPLERASFYVLKNPAVPSVLLELGYLSNPRELELLSDPAYQDRLAEALAVSLRSHLLAVHAPPTAVAAGR